MIGKKIIDIDLGLLILASPFWIVWQDFTG